jgi:[protein-PII] uridylyltransferase
MNPSESDRFGQSVRDVLQGRASLAQMLRGRTLAPPAAKVRVETKMHFEDESSAHCTLLELVAQDRPGLLYTVSTVLAEADCNIEVALIDTEGQKVVDVFYLRSRGAKLTDMQKDRLRETLLTRLGE